MKNSEEYKLMCKIYGTQKAKRSGVLYMNHIDEGLLILDWIGASESAKKAYIIHPLYQGDSDLANNHWRYAFHTYVMVNVIEYRSVANEYLSTRTIQSIDQIRLSPLKDINDMLIADKIQNFKDFELYHKGIHINSEKLNQYFTNWLTKLGVSREKYEEYKNKLILLG